MLKLLSLFMAFYLYIFQLPLMMLNLQGYLCSENPASGIVLPDVECGSVQNQIMIIVSTVTLLAYLAFLITQYLLYTSLNFETSIPWGCLENSASMARLLWKALIACEFILDKQEKARDEVGLLCSMLGFLIVSKRMGESVMIHTSVHYASLTYDILLSWLYLGVSVIHLSGSELSTSNLTFMGLSGLFMAGASIIVSETRKRKQLIQACKRHQLMQTDNVHTASI